MPRHPFALLVPALLALLLAACATGGGGPAPAVDAAEAERLEADGDFRGAALVYRQLAKSNRGAREALLLRAAEALREDGDWDGITAIAEDIRRKRLDAGQSARLDLLLAEVALAGGDAERALALATLPEDALHPAYRPRLHEIRARALLASGRVLESARARLALDAALAREERASNQTELLDALATLEPAQLQTELATLPPADALRPWIERALRLKGAVPARSIPRPTRQAGTLMPGDDADRPWRREGYAETPRVGLLLPLSGELGAAGRAVRDGFLAAYFADTERRPQVRLFDTGDGADGALEAYERARADGVARVVGPLTREQVQAIFERTDTPVPVLALNHPDNGAAPPVDSQQFGLLPDDEGALAAERARTRGLARVAILAGMEEWSERAALAFRAQFEQAGGVVSGEGRLAAEQVDFSAAIAQAIGAGADGVFLAVRPAQGRLVVPQLRARGLDAAPLLATSHIYGGAPNRGLDRDLNGVEFCDSPWLFDLAAGLPPRAALARQLPSVQAAPRLVAFGMDAYRLLPYLDWLGENTDAFLPGASGQLAIDAFGRVRRLMAWLRFVDGVPQSADGGLLPETGATP